jgi:HAE1 family hydrophobic/amphiphilic exporter-1
MLIGLVCKMRLCLWITPIEELREEHKNRNSSESRTSSSILMTTIAMVFGMFPIALASGAGAEWKNGLAWVIGGLIVHYSNLIIVPVIYEIMEKLIAKFSKGQK